MKSSGFSGAMKRVFLGWASRLLIGAALVVGGSSSVVGGLSRMEAKVAEDSQGQGVSYVGYGLGLLGFSCAEGDGIFWNGPQSQ